MESKIQGHQLNLPPQLQIQLLAFFHKPLTLFASSQPNFIQKSPKSPSLQIRVENREVLIGPSIESPKSWLLQRSYFVGVGNSATKSALKSGLEEREFIEIKSDLSSLKHAGIY